MLVSALFAWAMLMHPGRLPAKVEAQAREIMPNRLAFFEELFLSKPVFYRTGEQENSEGAKVLVHGFELRSAVRNSG